MSATTGRFHQTDDGPKPCSATSEETCTARYHGEHSVHSENKGELQTQWEAEKDAAHPVKSMSRKEMRTQAIKTEQRTELDDAFARRKAKWDTYDFSKGGSPDTSNEEKEIDRLLSQGVQAPVKGLPELPTTRTELAGLAKSFRNDYLRPKLDHIKTIPVDQSDDPECQVALDDAHDTSRINTTLKAIGKVVEEYPNISKKELERLIHREGKDLMMGAPYDSPRSRFGLNLVYLRLSD